VAKTHVNVEAPLYSFYFCTLRYRVIVRWWWKQKTSGDYEIM